MATLTINHTRAAGSVHTPRLASVQACLGCTWLVCSVPEAADGVGWCQIFRQCRSVHIDRDCGEFRTRKTED